MSKVQKLGVWVPHVLRPDQQYRVFQQHNNACSHIANMTKAANARLGSAATSPVFLRVSAIRLLSFPLIVKRFVQCIIQ